jgi:hypothetical protein
MSHNISLYLINKSDLREDKVNSIINDIQFEELDWVEIYDNILATPSNKNIKELSKGKTIFHIETDYFGGFGDQKATIYKDGEEVFSEDSQFGGKEPINECLKLMGVQKENGKDEFDTIGLRQIRSNYDLKYHKKDLYL